MKSLLELSLKTNDKAEKTVWNKTVPLLLRHPEFVIKELVEMLEDIEPVGGMVLKSYSPNGIEAYATENEIKLQGGKLDPDRMKLDLLATWASKIDNARTKYEDAQEYMQDLYRNEPGRADIKMVYINKHNKLMPHWKSDTDMEFLCAVSELSYSLTDARKALESLGKTTLPENWSGTVATLLANLYVVQMMKTEASMKH